MRVQFVVVTDRADCQTIDLSLTANLVPSWEVLPAEPPPENPLDKTASVQYHKIITRRLGLDGLSMPTVIDSTEPFRVRFIGDATEQAGPGATLESQRVVEVALASGQNMGFYMGELSLKWEDGTSKAHPIRCEVSPHLRAMPATLVVSPNESLRKHRVVVISNGRPFRILKVIGQAIVDPIVHSLDSAVTHLLDIELDSSRLDPLETSEIVVATDHPDQASLKIKVIHGRSERRATP